MTILHFNKDTFTEKELTDLFFICIEELDRRSYGKDDEIKNNKQLMKIAFPTLEEEIKSLFLQLFGGQNEFDINNLKDLIEQFSQF